MDKTKVTRLFLKIFGYIFILAGIASIYYIFKDSTGKITFNDFTQSILFFIVGPLLVYLSKHWKKDEE